MNLKFDGNQVTSFFKLNQQYFFTVNKMNYDLKYLKQNVK